MLPIRPTFAAIYPPHIAILASPRLIIIKFHPMASIVIRLAVRPISTFFTGTMARFALMTIDVNNSQPILFIALQYAGF